MNYTRPPRQAPQYSPPRLKERPTVSPFLKSDRVLLADAVDAIGKQNFGDDWTGKELLARHHVIPSSGPQSREIHGTPPAPITQGVGHVAPMGRGHPVCPARTVWLVETSLGIKECDSQDAAKELWNANKDEVNQDYKSEVAARIRFMAAMRKTRELLADGTWTAYIFDRGPGREEKLPVEFWLSDDAAPAFELEDDIRKWRNPNTSSLRVETYSSSYMIHGHVIVPRSYLSELPQSVVEPKVQPLDGTPKNATEFLTWARAFTESDNGNPPSPYDAYKKFAKPKGLSRNWARDQYKALPPELRRKRGEKKHTGK